MGRFLSVDPVGYSGATDSGMFGRYSYVGNDPVNFTDPDGRCVWDICIVEAIAAVAAVAVVACWFLCDDITDNDNEIWSDTIGTSAAEGISEIIDGISNSDNESNDGDGHTTPDGNKVRGHGKKGSGEDYIKGQGHTDETVDDIFGDGSEEVDDGGHDNASGQEKTPTTVTVGQNGDWARTNDETGEIVQVNDRNNPRQPTPQQKDD
jgi:hypothetical protein